MQGGAIRLRLYVIFIVIYQLSMLYKLVAHLLDIVVGFLASACLLRLYMQYQRVPFQNSLGKFVFAVTDWLVLPLRRIIPAFGRWDMASLWAAGLLQLIQYFVLWLLADGWNQLATLPILALHGVMRMVLIGLIFLLIFYALLSWFQSNPGLHQLMRSLCDPLLRPVQRVVPLVGGIDLSPVILIVALQMVLMVITEVRDQLLGLLLV